MPSNDLILCSPLLLLPSIFPSIRVFSSESVLHIRWPKFCRFSISISLSSEYSGLILSGWTGWISLQFKGTQESSPKPSSKSSIFPLSALIFLLAILIPACASSVQFSSVAQSCPTPCDPNELHHVRPPCSSPTPGVHTNLCPLNR